ncbi:response regulator [Scytonema sp. NUACC21]
MDKQPLVLLVEHNLHYLELLNSYFKRLNWLRICAKQGVKALSLAQTHQPNLILLDIALPDLSGLQVIHYLKQNQETRTIPIIGMIASTREEDGNNVLLVGADSYISKPCNFYDLEQAICHHLKLGKIL